MIGAMIRAAERWRAIKVTDFERRQMEALRKEHENEYEIQNGLAKSASQNIRQTKNPAENGLDPWSMGAATWS